MTLADPSTIITTDLNDITYIAGQEPWNKNLDQYSFEKKETDINTYSVDWAKWHGIYRTIPEARSTIDVWCKWIVGKKIIQDAKTKKITDRIKGNGIDSIRTILINLKRTSKICGDAYAEIIRDLGNRVINLKVINSGSIRIEANDKGIIKRYVQIMNQNTSVKETDSKTKESFWSPDKILHITNDRIADEIHGIPELEKTFNIMKWKHQSMGDLATVFHRYVQPVLEIYTKTDDPTELADIRRQYGASFKGFENRIIPAGVIEKIERVSIPQFSTLDPLPWQKFLRSYWTETSNVPDIIRGKSDEVSLAAGKLNVFSFKEKIVMEQLEYSEMIKLQTGLEIGFEPPPDLDVEIDNNQKAENKNNNTNENNNDEKTKRTQTNN